MSLPVVALVLASLFPPTVSLVAGQNVQVIKGGKKGGAARQETAASVQTAPDAQANGNADLAKKAADLDARAKALDAKDAQLKEREANAEEEKKQQQDKEREALRKKIEQLGQQNRAAWQDATNALSGE
jgi:Skp family chaperone for outer membrane proteins